MIKKINCFTHIFALVMLVAFFVGCVSNISTDSADGEKESVVGKQPEKQPDKEAEVVEVKEEVVEIEDPKPIVVGNIPSEPEKKEPVAKKATKKRPYDGTVVIKDAASEKEYQIAESFAEDVLMGMKDNKYLRFIKNFRQTEITEKKFKLMMERFEKDKGIYSGKREYLGSLKKGPVRVFMWKVKFDKTVKNRDGDEVKLDDDTLFRLVVGELDKKYYVLGFGFN